MIILKPVRRAAKVGKKKKVHVNLQSSRRTVKKSRDKPFHHELQILLTVKTL